jgi:excisionase family DNA binding protein
VDGFPEKPPSTLPTFPGPNERLLTVPQVAHRLSVSPATVYSLVSRGALRHLRVSNAIRVKEADLKAYCEGAS